MEASAIKNGSLAVIAAIGSAFISQLGGWDAALNILVIIMAVDYMTGLIVAGIFKRSGKSETGALNSRAGFQGLAKKVSILFLVLIGAQLDVILDKGAVARTAVILFYCGNEGLSILENIGLMGMPYPKFLKQALEVLREKGDNQSS